MWTPISNYLASIASRVFLLLNSTDSTRRQMLKIITVEGPLTILSNTLLIKLIHKLKKDGRVKMKIQEVSLRHQKVRALDLLAQSLTRTRSLSLMRKVSILWS